MEECRGYPRSSILTKCGHGRDAPNEESPLAPDGVLCGAIFHLNAGGCATAITVLGKTSCVPSAERLPASCRRLTACSGSR